MSTGVVAAGCKHTVGARLKRAGMHWTVAGAPTPSSPCGAASSAAASSISGSDVPQMPRECNLRKSDAHPGGRGLLSEPASPVSRTRVSAGTARVLPADGRAATDRGRSGRRILAAVLATGHRPRRLGRGVNPRPSRPRALPRRRDHPGLLFMARDAPERGECALAGPTNVVIAKGMRRSEVSARPWRTRRPPPRVPRLSLQTGFPQ